MRKKLILGTTIVSIMFTFMILFTLIFFKGSYIFNTDVAKKSSDGIYTVYLDDDIRNRKKEDDFLKTSKCRISNVYDYEGKDVSAFFWDELKNDENVLKKEFENKTFKIKIRGIFLKEEEKVKFSYENYRYIYKLDVNGEKPIGFFNIKDNLEDIKTLLKGYTDKGKVYTDKNRTKELKLSSINLEDNYYIIDLDSGIPYIEEVWLEKQSVNPDKKYLDESDFEKREYTKIAKPGSKVFITQFKDLGLEGFEEQDYNFHDTVKELVVDENGTNILRVYYKRNRYTLTFDAGNGKFNIFGIPNPYPLTFKHGDEIDVDRYTPQSNVRGESFKCWEPELPKIATKDATFKAIYEIHKYKINYELKVGETNHKDNITEFTQDTEFTLLPASKVNEGFVGWYLDEKFKTIITKIEKGTKHDLTLYPRFTGIDNVIVNIEYINKETNNLIEPSRRVLYDRKNVVYGSVRNDFLGYEFDLDKTKEVTSDLEIKFINGQYELSINPHSQGDLTIKLYYTPDKNVKFNYNVKYVDSEDKEIFTPYTGEGYVGEKIILADLDDKIKKPDIPGYTYKEDTLETNVTSDGKAEIKVIYEKDPEQYVTITFIGIPNKVFVSGQVQYEVIKDIELGSIFQPKLSIENLNTRWQEGYQAVDQDGYDNRLTDIYAFFNNWEDENGDTLTKNTVLTENIKLKARFKPAEGEITFKFKTDKNGYETIVNDVEFKVEAKYGEPIGEILTRNKDNLPTIWGYKYSKIAHPDTLEVKLDKEYYLVYSYDKTQWVTLTFELDNAENGSLSGTNKFSVLKDITLNDQRQDKYRPSLPSVTANKGYILKDIDNPWEPKYDLNNSYSVDTLFKAIIIPNKDDLYNFRVIIKEENKSRVLYDSKGKDDFKHHVGEIYVPTIVVKGYEPVNPAETIKIKADSNQTFTVYYKEKPSDWIMLNFDIIDKDEGLISVNGNTSVRVISGIKLTGDNQPSFDVPQIRVKDGYKVTNWDPNFSKDNIYLTDTTFKASVLVDTDKKYQYRLIVKLKDTNRTLYDSINEQTPLSSYVGKINIDKPNVKGYKPVDENQQVLIEAHNNNRYTLEYVKNDFDWASVTFKLDLINPEAGQVRGQTEFEVIKDLEQDHPNQTRIKEPDIIVNEGYKLIPWDYSVTTYSGDTTYNARIVVDTDKKFRYTVIAKCDDKEIGRNTYPLESPVGEKYIDDILIPGFIPKTQGEKFIVNSDPGQTVERVYVKDPSQWGKIIFKAGPNTMFANNKDEVIFEVIKNLSFNGPNQPTVTPPAVDASRGYKLVEGVWSPDKFKPEGELTGPSYTYISQAIVDQSQEFPIKLIARYNGSEEYQGVKFGSGETRHYVTSNYVIDANEFPKIPGFKVSGSGYSCEVKAVNSGNVCYIDYSIDHSQWVDIMFEATPGTRLGNEQSTFHVIKDHPLNGLHQPKGIMPPTIIIEANQMGNNTEIKIAPENTMWDPEFSLSNRVSEATTYKTSNWTFNGDGTYTMKAGFYHPQFKERNTSILKELEKLVPNTVKINIKTSTNKSKPITWYLVEHDGIKYEKIDNEYYRFEPVEWIVKPESSFIYSKYILDYSIYDEFTWGGTDICKYSDSYMKMYIEEVMAAKMGVTKTNLTLPTKEEMETNFKGWKERQAMGTEFAEAVWSKGESERNTGQRVIIIRYVGDENSYFIKKMKSSWFGHVHRDGLIQRGSLSDMRGVRLRLQL